MDDFSIDGFTERPPTPKEAIEVYKKALTTYAKQRGYEEMPRALDVRFALATGNLLAVTVMDLMDIQARLFDLEEKVK